MARRDRPCKRHRQRGADARIGARDREAGERAEGMAGDAEGQRGIDPALEAAAGLVRVAAHLVVEERDVEGTVRRRVRIVAEVERVLPVRSGATTTKPCDARRSIWKVF